LTHASRARELQDSRARTFQGACPSGTNGPVAAACVRASCVAKLARARKLSLPGEAWIALGFVAALARLHAASAASGV